MVYNSSKRRLALIKKAYSKMKKSKLGSRKKRPIKKSRKRSRKRQRGSGYFVDVSNQIEGRPVFTGYSDCAPPNVNLANKNQTNSVQYGKDLLVDKVVGDVLHQPQNNVVQYAGNYGGADSLSGASLDKAFKKGGRRTKQKGSGCGKGCPIKHKKNSMKKLRKKSKGKKSKGKKSKGNKSKGKK